MWWAGTTICALLFLPPIPLAFLEAHRSRLLPAFILPVLYMLGSLLRRRRIIWSLPLLPTLMAAWLVFHVALCLLEQRFVAGFKEVQWLIYFVGTYSMVRAATSSADPGVAQGFSRLIWAVLTIESIIGIVTAFTGPIFEQFTTWVDPRFGLSFLRATGTVESPNTLGGILSFGLVWCLHAPLAVSRVWRFLSALIILAALVMCQSKSAALSTTIALLAVNGLGVMMDPRTTGRRTVRRLLSFVALGIAVAGVGVIAGDSIRFELVEDYAVRGEFGLRVVERYQSFSWFDQAVGLGITETADIDRVTGVWMTAHNSYVALMAELGATFLILFLLLTIRALIAAVRHGRWHAVGGLIVILSHSFSEYFLISPFYVTLLAATLAIISPARRRARAAHSLRPMPSNGMATADPSTRWTR